MIQLWFLITFALLFPPASLAISDMSPPAFSSAVRTYLDNDQYLHARTLIKGFPLTKLNYQQWLGLRTEFHSYYLLGWDLLLYWDQNAPQPMPKAMQALYNRIQEADRQLEKKQFLSAARAYHKVAQDISGRRRFVSRENRLLYFSILHSLGRALYGAKKYKDALTVYTWISPIYPRFKQTLIERAWSAFMAGDLGQATGSVVSQYSSYFGGFIDPEIYLIQIYLYRLLCRKDDLKATLENLEKFRSGLAKRELTAIDWARSHFETLPYVRLVSDHRPQGDSLISTEMLIKERESILTWIKAQYEAEREQLLLEAAKANAYAQIALSATRKEMAPVEKLPPREELLRSGREAWPVEDAEDWLDEIGLHLFIGDSQCSKTK